MAVFAALGVLAVVARFTDDDRLFVVAGVVFVVVAGLGGIAENRRYWRGESPRSRKLDPPSWWPYSPGLWRGNVRSTPVMAVGAIPMFASGTVLIAVSALGWPVAPAELGGWYGLLQLATAAIWLGVPGMGISVVLLNRPRAVVPPHLRDQTGMLQGDSWTRRS